MMIFILLLLILSIRQSYLQVPHIYVQEGRINETLKISINKFKESIIFYNHDRSENPNEVLRFFFEVYFEDQERVYAVIKNGFDIIDGIKLENYFNNSVIKAGKTLCPLSYKKNKNETIVVEVSSSSKKLTNATLLIMPIDHFNLSLKNIQEVSLDYYSSQYFQFEFPERVSQVVVKVNSNDQTCMTFSIQETKCPVHDRELNIRYSGIYQTVTTTGSITVEKSTFGNKFFIVFVINPNDITCAKQNGLIPIVNRNTTRRKMFSLIVEDVPTFYHYIFPIFGAIAFYLMFYIAALFISFIYRLCAARNAENKIEVEPVNQMDDPVGYGSINDVADMQTVYSQDRRNYQCIPDVNNPPSSVKGDELNPSEYGPDNISRASSDPNINRLKKPLFVSDLAQKHPAILDRKYFLYLWYLIIISLFYGLPVIQLVLTYQRVVRVTGNEDICYYNFRCTRPLFKISAFNNVISNIGYVMLGILFVLVTYRRDKLYVESKRFKEGILNKGVPQYYGLFYAMGMALTMEGVLSACYHICPSNSNFQFDTAYMYILACLCMIKVYQMRHPDVNATAHSFFMYMSLIILVGVIGVVYNSKIFWICFTILYIIASVIISLEVYYVGRWRFRISFPQRLHASIKLERWRYFIPTYPPRMVVICSAYLLNFGIALYGGIHEPNNFASYFLAIFMINLLLYFFFYIAMKIYHCEKLSVLSIIYIIVAGICWAFAIYCFIKHPTDWQKTPAKSRELNQDCIFLNFYDIHDIWHFLSSMSLFFSFLALQTLDDKLFIVHRHEIPVF